MSQNQGLKLEENIVNKYTDCKHSASALRLLEQSGVDMSKPFVKANHDKNLINGRIGEVKTDIIAGDLNISVKKHGPVQLVSCGGDTAAGYFKIAAKKCFNSQFPPGLKDIIEDMGSLPKKLKPHDKDLWNAREKDSFNHRVNTILTQHPSLKREIIKISLTGEGIFSNPESIASVVLTPEKIRLIDEEYIANVSSVAKFNFRMKTRKGISEVNLRIDVNMKKIP
jgi:hypothetical protein